MSSASPSFTATFRLHEVQIRTAANAAPISDLMRRALCYKGATADALDAPADLVLDFATHRAPASIPDVARRLGRTEHGSIWIWHSDGTIYLRRGDATVVLHPEAGRAQAHLSSDLSPPSDARRDPLFYLITLSLAILLRYQGWFPLHAAALVRNSRGVLLTAESDSGKSTTTLNLVRQGWSYLSDDSVLLRATNGDVRAYSFRTDFCVDPDAADLFPELADTEWPPSLSDSTKWRVDGGAVFPGQFTPACVPRVLIQPSIVDQPTSSLTPADSKAILGTLFRQGALSIVPDRSIADAHLHLLKRLVHQAEAYHLKAGRDALDTPEVLAHLLAPVVS